MIETHRQLSISGDPSGWADPIRLRPIVVVLGMHRSGTSLCAHLLSLLGIDMADDPLVHESNARGHWERWEIVNLQDEILRLFDRDYRSLQHDFPLPPGWWGDPRVRPIQIRIEAFLTSRMGSAPFGFKDPRTARLLPMWLQIFRNLNLAPKFVICLRPPAQIARSLHKCDGLDPSVGEYRALAYQVDCFRYLQNHDFRTVEYETWVGDYADTLHGLMEFLGLRWDQSAADLANLIAEAVDPGLRHDDHGLGVARLPLARNFYGLCRALRDDPQKRVEIDRFVNQFVAFQQLLWPFALKQRTLAETAAAIPALTARVAELDGALAQERASHEAALAQMRALSDRDEARASEIEAERAARGAAETRERELAGRLAESEAAAALVAGAKSKGGKAVAAARRNWLGKKV